MFDIERYIVEFRILYFEYENENRYLDSLSIIENDNREKRNIHQHLQSLGEYRQSDSLDRYEKTNIY